MARAIHGINTVIVLIAVACFEIASRFFLAACTNLDLEFVPLGPSIVFLIIIKLMISNMMVAKTGAIHGAHTVTKVAQRPWS